MLKIKSKNNNQGFTLIEMLLVIGLVALIGTFALFVDFNNYRGDAFRSEVSSLGVALQTARADALNNIGESRHGVAIHPGGYNGYVIFEGDTYATANHAKDNSIKASYDVTFSALPTEIVFDQLSGNASYDGNITATDPIRNITAIINTNHEGRISW